MYPGGHPCQVFGRPRYASIRPGLPPEARWECRSGSWAEQRGEMLISRALRDRKLTEENQTLRQQVDERYGLENIIGESPALHEVLNTIRQVAPCECVVGVTQSSSGRNQRPESRGRYTAIGTNNSRR